MKSITKLTLAASAFAVIATSAAFADNPQLQNQLALQRAQTMRAEEHGTIAVYADERGVGQNATQSTRQAPRFELRTNAHGQTYGAYVAAE